MGRGKDSRLEFCGQYNKLKLSQNKHPSPTEDEGCQGTKHREPAAPCAASQSDLRSPVALWPSRVGSSAGSGSRSVQLVLQLVQDANHDLPEGLAGAAEGDTADAEARTEARTEPARGRA